MGLGKRNSLYKFTDVRPMEVPSTSSVLGSAAMLHDAREVVSEPYMHFNKLDPCQQRAVVQ